MTPRTATVEPTAPPHARSAAALLTDEAALRDTVVRYGAWVGAASMPVATGLAFKAYAWTVIEPAVTAWLRLRQVPDHAADRVAVTGGAGGYRLSVLDRRLTVLPDDPLAGAPGVAVVADPAALRAELRATLVDRHLAPAVEAFRRIRGGGARPLWGSVAQWLAYPATVASPAAAGEPSGPSLGDRHAAVAELLGLLPAELAALVEVAEIHDGREWRPLLLRRTCCFAYALPTTDLCTTCCVLSDAQRDAVAARHGMRWRRLPG